MRRFGYRYRENQIDLYALGATGSKRLCFYPDGNEQFLDANQFRLHWNELTNNLPDSFLDHLLFVEQPFHRDIALSESIGEALRDWKDAPPIIIDESDGDLIRSRQQLLSGIEERVTRTVRESSRGLSIGRPSIH